MAKQINDLTIEDEFDEWGVRYEDGEVLILEGPEDVDSAINAAKQVVPDVDMTKMHRKVFVSEWTEAK